MSITIEMAEEAVVAAKQRLAKAYFDASHSGPTLEQFEKVWEKYGNGSVEAERLEYVAKQNEIRISKEIFDARNAIAHAEMNLRFALRERSEQGGNHEQHETRCDRPAG